MANFLSAEWFVALNETLSRVDLPPLRDRTDLRVVLEFVDGPSTAPHAMALTVNETGAFAEPGDHLAADAVVRLTFADAEALSQGTLESAVALREGRLKVRGDVQALVPLLDWLLESHTS
jgi:hypothetical protein